MESLKSVLIDVVTPCDQVIAACASAKVGAEATSSSTGLPSERIATQPEPRRTVLNRPPPIMPLAPATFLMSQSMSASMASRLRPLTVICSPSSLIRCTCWAVSARKTSPVPETFMRSWPSPVSAFFMNFDMPPDPACSKVTSPW